MSKQDRQGARTPADLERKYNFGQSFAEVYGLLTDAQRAVEEANKAVQSLTPDEIFNRLTNYGEIQGIYRENDQIYINAEYIKGGKVKAEYIDADNLQVNAANITGVLSASQIDVSILDTDNLFVSAANVYGVLNSDTIALSGKLRVFKDETQSKDVYGGSIGYYSGETSDGKETQGITIQKSNSDFRLTDGGIEMEARGAEDRNDSSITITGNINLITEGNIHLTGTGVYTNGTLISSSDSRKKNTIQYDIDKYLPIFDALTPASFYYNEHTCGKRHLGFIAQDVEQAMLSAGITHEEFALLDISDDGYYGLRYEEFIPVLVAKIKQLEGEVRSWKS